MTIDKGKALCSCAPSGTIPSMSTTHTIRANSTGSIRYEIFEGRNHLVVPVVMIVEGVLNGALVPASEFSKFTDAWNNRPVPVLHPTQDGLPISANAPDVLEKNTVGCLFNTRVEQNKLKSEAWIDIEKANRLGHGDLVKALESGAVIEVSTGYYSDSDPVAGAYGGKEYSEIHRNIRPDHLALLPGEIGACSVADGCGVRANTDSEAGGLAMKTRAALEIIAQALGLRSNNDDDGDPIMTDKNAMLKRAEALQANAKMSTKQLDMLQALGDDETHLALARAFIDALEAAPATASYDEDKPENNEQRPNNDGATNETTATAETETETPTAETETETPTANGAVMSENFEEIVNNRVDELVRRREATNKLVANKQCPFNEDELKTMSVDHLEKLERSIRPADYSGQGGFATNAGITEGVEPLTANVGLLSRKEH